MKTIKRILTGVMFSGLLMAATPAALTIPKAATANSDGTYSWTDKQGKEWVYVNTPFGVSRTLVAGANDTRKTPAAKNLPKGIPVGAKINPDGTYAFTDKAGAKWTYTITPFGPSRMPAGENQAAAQNTGDLSVKVIDKGGTVRFERPTPFGPSIWEKKKSELNDDERRLVDTQAAAMPKAN